MDREFASFIAIMTHSVVFPRPSGHWSRIVGDGAQQLIKIKKSEMALVCFCDSYKFMIRILYLN